MTTVTAGSLAEFITEIVAPDPKWLKQARVRLDNLTKPLARFIRELVTNDSQGSKLCCESR